MKLEEKKVVITTEKPILTSSNETVEKKLCFLLIFMSILHKKLQ